VVVTGGTGALGSAVVGAFLDAGATCHVPSHHPGELIGYPHLRHPSMHVTENVDLTDDASVTSFYGALPGLFASIHLAGGFTMSPLTVTSKEDLLRMVNVNLTTCFLCCREAARRISASEGQDGGRIVNVAAKAGIEPTGASGMAAYAASKAGLDQLTKVMAVELGAHNIRVNSINPTVVMTDMGKRAWSDPSKGGPMLARIPLQRFAECEDIASVVCFVLSDAAGMLNGLALRVDGGFSAT
jgi:NAD(P)-dependent dehydrogenase (short-subunit alcohol dehydrogenase family)